MANNDQAFEAAVVCDHHRTACVHARFVPSVLSSQTVLSFSSIRRNHVARYKVATLLLCSMAHLIRRTAAHTSCVSGMVSGTSCQLPVDVVDEVGRVWPMTYRCVPHRYR